MAEETAYDYELKGRNYLLVISVFSLQQLAQGMHSINASWLDVS